MLCYKALTIDLEPQLSEAQQEHRGAKSLSVQTRSGYIYILVIRVHVFKIGMTCREDPALERTLHIQLDARRMNQEDQRNEFFRTTIDEIKV